MYNCTHPLTFTCLVYTHAHGMTEKPHILGAKIHVLNNPGA